MRSRTLRGALLLGLVVVALGCGKYGPLVRASAANGSSATTSDVAAPGPDADCEDEEKQP